VHQWQNGFQGQFTIDNKGSKPIHGWELTAVLSGDQVRWAWPAWFHMSGDTLTLDPPPSQKTIPPGTSLTENFMADGTTTSPSSCTFNGSPC
jgi:endoglucanase